MARDTADMLLNRQGYLLSSWLAYAVVYVCLDYVSFLEPYRGLAITPWSPPSGLALAVVILWGCRFAPIVVMAPAVAGIIVRAGAVPHWVQGLEGLLIGGSYLALGLLLRRSRTFDPRLHTVGDVVLLAATAAAAAALAAFGYISLLKLSGLLGQHEIGAAFVRFLVGDLIGVLIATPLLLLAATVRPWPRPSWETPLQLIAIAAVLAVVFTLPYASELQLFYLLFVPLLWCTLRHGIVGGVLALATIQIGLIAAVQLLDRLGSDLIAFQMLMISLSATGLALGALVTQQEAASRRLATQQLALSRALRLRSMGETATTIAHEINQPITSIKTFAGIAETAIAQADTRRAAEAIIKLRSECDRAGAIIRATRDLLSQRSLVRVRINVHQALAEIHDLLGDRLRSANVTLLTDIGAEVANVEADAIQLRQALYNLVENSIEAISTSATRGVIAISAHPSGPGQVEFEVRDTGPGFPGGPLDLAPGPFVTTKPDGMGIGLSIVRSIAEAHGGGLSFDRCKGGAVVKLRLSSAR